MAHPATSLNFEQHASSRKSQAAKPEISTFEDLLGLHEAASLLGMHWKTLEGMARTRKIPAFKVGKRWKASAARVFLCVFSPIDARRIWRLWKITMLDWPLLHPHVPPECHKDL
jgi:excisionase family DNA binding protein